MFSYTNLIKRGCESARVTEAPLLPLTFSLFKASFYSLSLWLLPSSLHRTLTYLIESPPSTTFIYFWSSSVTFLCPSKSSSALDPLIFCLPSHVIFAYLCYSQLYVPGLTSPKSIAFPPSTLREAYLLGGWSGCIPPSYRHPRYQSKSDPSVGCVPVITLLCLAFEPFPLGGKPSSPLQSNPFHPGPP